MRQAPSESSATPKIQSTSASPFTESSPPGSIPSAGCPPRLSEGERHGSPRSYYFNRLVPGGKVVPLQRKARRVMPKAVAAATGTDDAKGDFQEF